MLKHAGRAPALSPTLPALDENHDKIMHDDTGHDMAEDCMFHMPDSNVPPEPIR